MEEEIKKMMAEYELKITTCEKSLKFIKQMNRDNRNSDKPELGLAISCSKDRAVTDAQKQAYIQAKADIESLLDYIPDGE